MANLIYALIDPETERLRYVGQTSIGISRAESHWLSKTELKRKTPCCSWVKSLLSKGKIPEIEILQICSSREDLDQSEIFWIGYFRMIGADLTNMSGGGRFYDISDSLRKRLSESHKGKKLTEQHKKNIAKANIGKHKFWSGKTHSEQTREKMRVAHKGKVLTAEHKRNIKLSWEKRREIARNSGSR